MKRGRLVLHPEFSVGRVDSQSDGNLTAEQYYGGDNARMSTLALCTMLLEARKYGITALAV